MTRNRSPARSAPSDPPATVTTSQCVQTRRGDQVTALRIGSLHLWTVLWSTQELSGTPAASHDRSPANVGEEAGPSLRGKFTLSARPSLREASRAWAGLAWACPSSHLPLGLVRGPAASRGPFCRGGSPTPVDTEGLSAVAVRGVLCVGLYVLHVHRALLLNQGPL